jgi:hypothetical protein
MAKKEALSLKATVALIIIIFLAGFGGTMWYYALYQVAYVQIYDIEVKSVEGNLIGFNADPTLHFGKIPNRGGTSQKDMILTNDWDIPLLVQIRLKGEAAQFISTDDNNFILGPKELRHVYFYATIPDGWNKTDIYTGEAKVMYLRP